MGLYTLQALLLLLLRAARCCLAPSFMDDQGIVDEHGNGIHGQLVCNCHFCQLPSCHAALQSHFSAVKARTQADCEQTSGGCSTALLDGMETAKTARAARSELEGEILANTGLSGHTYGIASSKRKGTRAGTAGSTTFVELTVFPTGVIIANRRYAPICAIDLMRGW
jgi:hypothetical protein